MPEPLLELNAVTRHFPTGDGQATVLREISLTIEAGEFVAIVGASGSGKSTLMNILGCLDRPSSGQYKVGGCETHTLSGDEWARLRRERFGFVFQRYHLLAHLSAADNVEMPAIYAGAAPSSRRSRALGLLTQLGIVERAGHRPGQLSGGQQQRVCIARALMNGGDVILADEPTGALDSQSGAAVLRTLFELNQLGHTVLIVTHDERVAAQADRIVEMRDGEIVRDERTRPVAARTPAARAAAGVPPARFGRGLSGLADALRMALSALASHRLRTLLTMLGIVIGIASVVSNIALGQGAKRYMLEEVGSMGTDTIDIYPGEDWGDSKASSIDTLVAADADALREQSYVGSVTPELARPQLVRFRDVDVEALVSGVGEKYFQVRGVQMSTGMPFDSDAVRLQRQVAVIDENTRRKLFGTTTDPLGKIILVERLPCVVVGVTARKKSAPDGNKNLNVWVPYTTAGIRLFGQRQLDRITVRVRDGQPGTAAEQSIVKLLLQRHGRKDFFTDNMDNLIKVVEKTGQSLTLLLSMIAVISLLVGGIGVMNVMLVSVTERTGEIGIRIAVGARRSDILQQFLAEAILVCLVGGALGVALSFGVSAVFSMFVDEWRMVFSAGAIASAFVCSMLCGVVFGFVPAYNAARLDPIAALARD